MKKIALMTTLLLLVLLVMASCGQGNEPETTPTIDVEPTFTSTSEVAPEIPTLEPTTEPAVEPTAAQVNTPGEVAADIATPAAAEAVSEGVADESATSVPDPDDDLTKVAELAVGTPGRYVNVSYGYIVEYPDTWYTGFGNRPLLASFSNLDPGATNRENMRAEGCLIETSVSPNVYSFNLETLIAQMPQTYENAERFVMDNALAIKVKSDNPELPYTRELVQVIDDGRLFTITAEMSRSAADTCLPAWEGVLQNWKWFTPDFQAYRNTEFGYSFSRPRSWQVIELSQSGEVVSSQPPTEGATFETLAQSGMVVRSNVFDNPELLPLKLWLLNSGEVLGLTNDIQADTLIGVRNITDWQDGTQKMIGYFQGPLGKIYAVECSYPVDRKREFRPIANAILYSFGF